MAPPTTFAAALASAFAGALAAAFPAPAAASGIYRCEIGGVTSFVDSPQRCPQGQAQRQGAAAAPAAPAAEPPAGRAAARVPASGLSVADCQRFAAQAVRLRQCLQDLRGVELRQLVGERLALMRRAIGEHFANALRSGHILAASPRCAPVAFCEEVLGDLLAGRGLEVVDNERTGGPEITVGGGVPGRSAWPVLDAGYRTWQLAAEAVPAGYVTLWWRAREPVVLHVMAACTEADDGTARCNPVRLSGVRVFGAGAPAGCDVTAYGREYWPQWQATVTPVFRQGLPPSSAAR